MKNDLYTVLTKKARQILRENDRGGYTVPTGGLYPYQWNWDSAFVALGFAVFDMDRAWQEIETLFEGQWEDGLVPHIIFRVDDPGYWPGPSVWRTQKSPSSSGITQPPVAATIIRELYHQSGDKERLAALFPKLKAWHDWFDRYRDPARNGVIVTVHPWETGRDNCPEWDAPAANIDTSNIEPYQRKDTDHIDTDMRPKKHDYDRYMAMVQFGRDCGWDHEVIANQGPFQVYDLTLTFILLRANRDLQWLAAELGLAAEAAELEARILRAEQGVAVLWDAAARCFCSRDRLTGQSSGLVTNASFLAFYAGVATGGRAESLVSHFHRIALKVDVTMPSTDPQSPDFDSRRYWRGPVWAVMNYMIARGFDEVGYAEEAARVRSDVIRAIEKSGFYESFDPLDATGSGGNQFSWTAAIWLHLQEKDKGVTRTEVQTEPAGVAIE